MTGVEIVVDGTPTEADVEPRLLLVHYLRGVAGRTGTNVGCDTSNCGSCTVLLEGRSVKSCTVLAVQADGTEVTTIEGIGSRPGDEARTAAPRWHVLQRTFHREHGLQCGYCTPGMIMAALDLLAENPDPSEEDIRHGLSGNLCRCTGYAGIVAAVRAAADELREQDILSIEPST